jgi:hypothetical protein
MTVTGHVTAKRIEPIMLHFADKSSRRNHIRNLPSGKLARGKCGARDKVSCLILLLMYILFVILSTMESDPLPVAKSETQLAVEKACERLSHLAEAQAPGT